MKMKITPPNNRFRLFVDTIIRNKSPYTVMAPISIIILLLMGCHDDKKENGDTFELKGKTTEEMNGSLAKLYDVNFEIIQLDTVKDQEFAFSVNVKEPSLGTMTLSKDNSVLLRQFVAFEPESLTLSQKERGYAKLEGGNYNKILFEDLKTPEYEEAEKSFNRITSGTGNLNGVKNPDDEYEGSRLFLKLEGLKEQYYYNLIQKTDDPYLQLMCAKLSNLFPDRERIMKIVNSAAKELGEENGLVQRVRRLNEEHESALERRKGEKVGEMFADIEGKTVDGSFFSLAPLVEENTYTLVQFWASWCGPCRREIPMLKGLYDEYNSKGLQIVSFSMDHNENSWIKASKVEQFVWPNFSDLQAFESPVTKTYPIMGIPSNVIIDRSGKIIASNLFGKDLEHKVKELF